MKTIHTNCKNCGATNTFNGKDAKAIMRAIDKANWHDGCNSSGRLLFFCDPCWQALPEDSETHWEE